MLGTPLFLGIDFEKIFQDIFSQLATAIPGIVGAILILIVGFIVAAITSKVTKNIFSKIGVDKFADKLNKIDLFSKLNIDAKPSNIISKVVYYILILITMMVAAEVSGMKELSDLMEKIIDFTPKALAAFILIIIGLVICDFIKDMIITACDSVGVPSGRIIANFIFYFLFITIVITALSQIGIPVDLISTNITLVIGGIVIAFAIGYGFASREVMASILSSFFYVKGKINLGDMIRVGKQQGQVVRMDSTSIILLKEDKNKVIIPLSRFAEEEVEIID